MTTGERIAQKRHEKGWTQHDLAKKLGLNSKSVKDWESSVSLPSAKTIVKLCHLLNVSSDYLLCLDSRETLYLDDLGAEVGQHGSGKGHCDEGAGGDDTHTGKRAVLRDDELAIAHCSFLLF